METIELTQEQLRIANLKLQGWQDLDGCRFDLWGRNPNDGCWEKAPNPTIEIAAAWELWKMRPEWADYALGFFGMHRAALFGTPPGGEYVEAVVAVEMERQVSLAMSCAYYELLTGKRVVLVPALEREGEMR